MEKMKMQSPDLTARNIEMLKSLFPSVVTETRGADGQRKQAVDFDTLQLLLGRSLADGPEAYRFTWVGKRAAIAEAARPIRKTLRPLTPPAKTGIPRRISTLKATIWTH